MTTWSRSTAQLSNPFAVPQYSCNGCICPLVFSDAAQSPKKSGFEALLFTLTSWAGTAGSEGCVLYRLWNVSVSSKKLTGQRDGKCSWLNEGKTKRHMQAMRKKMITSVLSSSRSSDFHVGVTIISLHDFKLANRKWIKDCDIHGPVLWLCGVTERSQKQLMWRLVLCKANKSNTKGTVPPYCRWQSRSQVSGASKQWLALPECSSSDKAQCPHFLSRS